jgi:glycosyltransferase involved in cell wall biosynthesis
LQIGVALPIASFGGVEKVAFALARVLADENCDLHLFGFGKPEVLLQEGQSYPFKTTNFLFDANYALWGGLRRYMGHELRIEHEDAAKTEDVVGLLLGLDVLICGQVAPLNAAIGRLRREGVKIVNHLHVIDETPQCRSVGHPYLALGFEHAYDAILTCSETLKAWLHGMGAPDEKLLVVHNAPGYAIDERRLANLLSLRTTPSAGSPLRSVFLGRLDEQKGVDRLILAVKAARQARLDIHWRVVGSAILSDGESDSWAEQLSNLGVRIEPPIFDSDQLSKIYLESDILLLPSRWEGAPLSIIEAQRLGCVPIATDVGAVNELIDDGVDGFLLPRSDDEKIALVLVSRLEELGQDREKLALISSRAIRRGAAPVWAKNVQPLIDVLRQWFPGRSFSDGAGRA